MSNISPASTISGELKDNQDPILLRSQVSVDRKSNPEISPSRSMVARSVSMYSTIPEPKPRTFSSSADHKHGSLRTTPGRLIAVGDSNASPKVVSAFPTPTTVQSLECSLSENMPAISSGSVDSVTLPDSAAAISDASWDNCFIEAEKDNPISAPIDETEENLSQEVSTAESDISYNLLQRMILQENWSIQRNAYGDSYLNDTATQEKWHPAQDESGSVYFYEETTHVTVWQLPGVTLDSQQEAQQLDQGQPIADVCEHQSEQPIAHMLDYLPEVSENAAAEYPVLPMSPMSPSLFQETNENHFHHLTDKSSDINASGDPESLKFGQNSKSSKLGSKFSGFKTGFKNSFKMPKKQLTKEHISEPHKITRSERQGKITVCEASIRDPLVADNWREMHVMLTGPKLLFYENDARSKPKVGQPEGIPIHDLIIGNIVVSDVPKDQYKKVVKHGIILEYLSEPDQEKDVYILKFHQENEMACWKSALQYSKDWNVEDRYTSIAPRPSYADKHKAKKFSTSYDDFDATMAKLKEFFRKRPTPEALRAKGILENERIFGSTLHQICESECTRVPTFVTRCIMAIESRDINATGLYRTSGNSSTIQSLRFKVNLCDNYDLNADCLNLPDLTGALKLFFRELREPLFPVEKFDSLVFTAIGKASETESRLTRMQTVLNTFPPVNFNTAKTLFQHLYKVILHSQQNQMISSNVALVISPNLMWSDIDRDQTIRTTTFMDQCRTVEYILDESPALFKFTP